MRTTITWGAAVPALAVVILLPYGLPAQTITHPDPYLNHIYPAGAQRGQTVTVELGAINGLTGASKLVIDGPPGITVRAFKSVNHAEARATLEVAADAAPGRRLLRVAGGSAGLTNGRPFFVGALPEVMEKDPNDRP